MLTTKSLNLKGERLDVFHLPPSSHSQPSIRTPVPVPVPAVEVHMGGSPRSPIFHADWSAPSCSERMDRVSMSRTNARVVTGRQKWHAEGTASRGWPAGQEADACHDEPRHGAHFLCCGVRYFVVGVQNAEVAVEVIGGSQHCTPADIYRS